MIQLGSFLNDYSSAVARAEAFDAQVKSDASNISTEYADWVALAVRQAFGAIEFTISKDSSGKFNTSDILVFMKGAPHSSPFLAYTFDPASLQRSRVTA